MTTFQCGGRTVTVCGDPATAGALLLQPTDLHEAGMPAEEAALLGEGTALAAFSVDWSLDLPPWPAPAVFRGEPDFGGGAPDTLRFVTEELLPALLPREKKPPVFLGGYSLAGLFALWAGYRSDAFDGVAAASPSVWYPGWTDWAAGETFRSPMAYLSLGDREERTRNPVMRTVGDAIRRQRALLAAQDIPSVLVMNPGNHFQNPAGRMAAGFRWLLEQGGPQAG